MFGYFIETERARPKAKGEIHVSVSDVFYIDANHFDVTLEDGRRVALYMDDVISVTEVGDQTVIQRQAEAHPSEDYDG